VSIRRRPPCDGAEGVSRMGELQRDDVSRVKSHFHPAAVYRAGDVAVRDSGPWTPTAHALLQQLEEVGFEAADRPHCVAVTMQRRSSAAPSRFHTQRSTAVGGPLTVTSAASSPAPSRRRTAPGRSDASSGGQRQRSTGRVTASYSALPACSASGTDISLNHWKRRSISIRRPWRGSR
jgi:hypothetical protein